MLTMLASAFTDFFAESYKEAFGGGMSEAVQEAIDPELVDFFGLKVNPSLYSAFLGTAVILIACVIIRIFVIPKFKKQPKSLQLLLEGLVGYFDKTASPLKRQASFVGPYIATAAIFICLTTLAELLGIRPAFASINTCLAFGLSTFFVINYCGLREKGLFGRAKRYLGNPINIITDLAVPLSLSFRLFGAIMSGFIIVELVYSVIFLSFVVPAVVSVITTIFHALIQSFLFATLSAIFIGEAVE